MAVNCPELPSGMDELAGVIAIDTKVGAPTVRVVDPLMVPEVAVIAVCPNPTLLAKPVVLLIVAVAVKDELHATELVRFCVLLSV